MSSPGSEHGQPGSEHEPPLRTDAEVQAAIIQQVVPHDAPITLAEYDPRWPVLFEREAARIRAALGATAVLVEHAGSTSVPGLAAKPIIDILAGVSDLGIARPCIELVAPLGYVHAPYRSDEMLWFCKPSPRRRTHHLHLVPVGSAAYRDELRFRNYLRAHPDSRDEYARLKQELAVRFRRDREAYTEAKTDFVRGILHRAAPSG